jgi:hypothetical protein
VAELVAEEVDVPRAIPVAVSHDLRRQTFHERRAKGLVASLPLCRGVGEVGDSSHAGTYTK